MDVRHHRSGQQCQAFGSAVYARPALHVDLRGSCEIKIDDFITYTMPLEEINRAFDLMHEGKSIRSVIHF